MTTIDPLPAAALRRSTDPETIPFTSTAEAGDEATLVGQERAIEALGVGIGIRDGGYNLFALGPSGLGKRTFVSARIAEIAATQDIPPDHCYVNRFEDSDRPRALTLPAGRGIELRGHMEHLVEDLRVALPAAFESSDYQSRKELIEEEFKEQQEQGFTELQKRAEELGIALIRTPIGIAPAPVKDDKVLGPADFNELPEEDQKRYKEAIARIQSELEVFVKQTPVWERQQRERMRDLNREVTKHAVGHLIDDVRQHYQDLPEVLQHLDAVQEDVLSHAVEFIRSHSEEGPEAALGFADRASDTSAFRRYRVNLLVDNSALEGAPIVHEDHPSLGNLCGRVEHISQMGALVTDFTLIKPGALHRANGGYLILDALRLLRQPFAWDQLKRILRSGLIKIESPGEIWSLVSTRSLEPAPIPLRIKLVLVGDRWLYYLLSMLDPDFPELFKVAVDFEDRAPREPQTTADFARLLASQAQREKLLPLDRTAIARILDHGARLAGDSERFSLNIRKLTDLMRESCFWATRSGAERASAEHVERAIDALDRRGDRIRRLVQEEIERGNILVDTGGERVGQVNGLSVLLLGDAAFGRPSRITARVRIGKGEVIDIERKVELGGPIHSKGVLILSSFLGARYAPDRPLALSASLVFEQSYGMVDGDSASIAETCALLSAIGDLPIRQGFAVTGSMNQNGDVQAIGGVNEKIEGYFEVCQQREPTGEQGVIIPESNVKHLMLRDEVVEAVEGGKFQIYPVATLDEAFELLTGVPAGARDPGTGRFPTTSGNGRVEQRLEALSELAREFAQDKKASDGSSD